ncbi:hypothetical protein XINFAN_00059 [Pseudogemmobacter humi]|uniref:Glycosyltransferase subfamily 4-like N-terminal domain-containing protein n=1 Tax=Pseudogemmobacter humi TaxID=2483812 RepID=A0A3P5WEV5_9RHOB|nr:hypothetical protein XINFAN_00059 [Pseudogemmobacter humi]
MRALIGRGHRVAVLAPPDGAERQFEAAGCRFRPLAMNVKWPSPRDDYTLMRRFGRIFATGRPDMILSCTIRDNIFGTMTAPRKAARTPGCMP